MLLASAFFTLSSGLWMWYSDILWSYHHLKKNEEKNNSCHHFIKLHNIKWVKSILVEPSLNACCFPPWLSSYIAVTVDWVLKSIDSPWEGGPVFKCHFVVGAKVNETKAQEIETIIVNGTMAKELIIYFLGWICFKCVLHWVELVKKRVVCSRYSKKKTICTHNT